MNKHELVIATVAASLGFVACQAFGNPPAREGCPTFSQGVSQGRIESKKIHETSGIAASHRNPGVYWLHNDSGDSPRLFAVDLSGRDLGWFVLKGAKAIDWEDIAVGPAADQPGSFIYVGDIGDNDSQRASITVYRVPEPQVSRSAKPEKTKLHTSAALRMTYPDDQGHDAEALLVDPENADLYIVTKERKGTARVYRAPAPHRAEETIDLEEVGVLQLGPSAIPGAKFVTGGDISSVRNQIVLRTYSHVFLWNRAPGQSIADAITAPPCPAPQVRERQGESIGWTLDGSGYITVSEGRHEPIHFFARSAP